uniref:Uncharacterized protein n=1 Tax=viral metagenome TaxID=1070528 RepID=A0A6C0HZN3_9ZZZZ
MFESKNIYKYAIVLGVIVVVSYFGDKVRSTFNTKDKDEYEMIKKYLLNDSPLYGYNKPKIWIHTKYDINARKWRDFYSRNTTDLNQPYIHLTIKSIINHCSDNFHICLIDDESFSKLIPTWDIDMNITPEPMRSQYRQLGLAQLLYYYGGMVVPNSFLCTRNLKELYDQGTLGSKPFVCEAINRSSNINNKKDGSNLLFIPSTYFMGSKKNNIVILEYVEYLKERSLRGYYTNEYEFLGDTSIGSWGSVNKGKMNLVGGEFIGIKTNKGKQVLLEDLMEDNYLDLNPNMYGIYIPQDEILSRPKFQWFAVLDSAQILETKTFIAKHFKASIVDSYYDTTNSGEIKSTVAI